MDLDLSPTKSADETEVDTPPHTHASSIKSHHPPPPPPVPVTYKECMKNHAAGIGGQAVDGCGEYMPLPSAALKDPTSLTCAACGCHRNFHRREPGSPTAAMTPPFLDFWPPGATPPPRASFQYSPHFLLGIGSEERRHDPATPAAENPLGRKRLRTKFSQEQKEKMHSFSEKLGWKMHKSDEAAVAEFCRGAGVAKGVLKVWMHNNKSTLGRKESGSRNLDAGFMSSEKGVNGGNGHSEKEKGDEEEEDEDDNGGRFHGGGVHFHNSNNNGSSSSALCDLSNLN